MKNKLAAVAVAGILGATAAFGGSESPVRLTGYSPVVWTNQTIRQWVGSMVCTFTTNYPATSINVSIVDSGNVTNLIASATNAAMKTFVYVSERGPLVINKGDKVMITYDAPDSSVVTLNNLTAQ